MSTALVSAADVEVIASEVWASLGADAGRPAGASPAGDDTVVGSVAIRGTFEGRVTLELGTAGADTVTTAMLGGADGVPADPADVADAIGELVNMIGGNVKSLMPAPSSLGLPAVARGEIAPDDAEHELCRAELSWDGTAVRVTVWQATPHPTTPTQEA